MRPSRHRRRTACHLLAVALFAAATVLLAGCPKAPPHRRGAGPPARGGMEGLASWYGEVHHGRLTASGEPFDMHALTAAHRRWRFGTRVRVTRLSNGRSVVVRINDRGPFKRGLILDLSREAARRLGMLRAGRARVRLVVIGRDDD